MTDCHQGVRDPLVGWEGTKVRGRDGESDAPTWPRGGPLINNLPRERCVLGPPQLD